MVKNAVAMYRSLYGRKFLILALAALIVALATACVPWDGRGTVVEKEYESPYTTTVLVGKVPVTQHHPECFELEIEDVEGNSHEVCVERAAWDSFEVGDRITITTEEAAS